MADRTGMRAGLRGALSLAIARVAFGLSFGALARAAGPSAEAAMVMWAAAAAADSCPGRAL